MNDMAKNVLVWLVIGLVLMTVFQSLSQRTGGTPELTYSEFLREVRSDNVARVSIAEDRMSISGPTRRSTRR
jgi:cell division protease FtsH